jgi:hypothetical protein
VTFCAPVQTGPGDHPDSYTMYSRPGAKGGQGVAVITQPQLVLRCLRSRLYGELLCPVTNFQKNSYMHISYSEFNPYWINVGSTDRTSFIPQSNVWLSLCQFSSLSKFCGYTKFLFKLDKNIENTGKISFMPFNKVCLSPHRFSWDCLPVLCGNLQYKFYLDQTNNGTM